MSPVTSTDLGGNGGGTEFNLTTKVVWWPNGHRASPLLCWPSFESRWNVEFYFAQLFDKKESRPTTSIKIFCYFSFFLKKRKSNLTCQVLNWNWCKLRSRVDQRAMLPMQPQGPHLFSVKNMKIILNLLKQSVSAYMTGGKIAIFTHKWTNFFFCVV